MMSSRTWLTVALLLTLYGSFTSSGFANGGAIQIPLADHIATGDTFMGVRLRGSIRLPTVAVDGMTLGGISALAWDQDENVLYAMSDLGRVFHLRPVLADGNLVDAEILGAYRLRDVHGKPLVKPWKDAEGLTLRGAANGVRGDTELLACFEVKQRIRRYDSRGKRLGGIGLPADLRDIDRYAWANASLEAITEHPHWGTLIAPERPLRRAASGQVPIYTLDGKHWTFPLYPAEGSALVALEVLADGSLLSLERAFVALTRPLVISIRRVTLPASTEQSLSVQTVAVLDTSRGWLLDNFEGLASRDARHFFIASDDNRSFLQSTLLVYFELL